MRNQIKMHRLLVLSVLFIPSFSLARPANFLAADFFDPIVPEINRPANWPAQATIIDSVIPMDKTQMMSVLNSSGVWRLGHTCSGQPIAMDRFLGKSLDAGQSARRPTRGMLFDENGDIRFVQLGFFKSGKWNAIGNTTFQCQLDVLVLRDGGFFLQCLDLESFQPIHLIPILIEKPDGSREMVFRTGVLIDFTDKICPAGTELFGVYSQVPTS